MITKMNIIEVYVTLLEEGTDTIRATDAINLGNDLYKLMPTDNYDPADEIWEFLPDSVVRVKESKDFHGRPILLAYEKVE